MTGKAMSPYARLVTPETLVGCGTRWDAVPFVPEIRLLTAAEPYGLWDRTGRDAPPFWAFPWAGGQALARYVLDNPGTVAARRVLDAASGSGLVAIAAAKAGAAAVAAGDIDLNAIAAIGVNAAANGTSITARTLDLATDDAGDVEVVLMADVFYQRELAALALGFARAAARSGAEVLVADPGRAFFPAAHPNPFPAAHPNPFPAAHPDPVPEASLVPLASYEVPVLRVLEDAAVKKVTVYRLA